MSKIVFTLTKDDQPDIGQWVLVESGVTWLPKYLVARIIEKRTVMFLTDDESEVAENVFHEWKTADGDSLGQPPVAWATIEHDGYKKN